MDRPQTRPRIPTPRSKVCCRAIKVLLVAILKLVLLSCLSYPLRQAQSRAMSSTRWLLVPRALLLSRSLERAGFFLYAIPPGNTVHPSRLWVALS